MLVTRKSLLSGIVRTMDLPITPEQVDNYNRGELAQRAFPQLPADEREFYISGATPEEWDEVMRDYEEYDL